MKSKEIAERVEEICRRAGAAIMEVYNRDEALEVTAKQDDSPVTEADLAAHRVIVEGLRELDPALPVLSEEAVAADWEERRRWSRYWLVDPLDGTKEFISRNGEFTVNIALVDRGEPVFGMVHVPVLGQFYWGSREGGAWRREGEETRAIKTSRIKEAAPLRVVASRRHGGDQLERWLETLRESFPAVELLSMGSSLKICLVAEGKADIYPRLAPTSEWDTAAAQAVLEAAGGKLTDTSLIPYRYNRKAEILNPWFLAIGDPAYPWERFPIC